MGAEFTSLGENYNDLSNETLQHDMNDRTRKHDRRRNIRIAKFWEEYCPEYYLPGRNTRCIGTRPSRFKKVLLWPVQERPTSLPRLECEVRDQIFDGYKEEIKWSFSVLHRSTEIQGCNSVGCKYG
jgi:hypothetical protein